MSKEIQQLLDESARLQNEAYEQDKVVDVSHYYTKIKELRGNNPPPCWGDDDCSTEFLMRCPWRIDCGT